MHVSAAERAFFRESIWISAARSESFARRMIVMTMQARQPHFKDPSTISCAWECRIMSSGLCSVSGWRWQLLGPDLLAPRRRGAPHRQVPPPQDHRQGELRQGQAGQAHTHGEGGKSPGNATLRTTILTQKGKVRFRQISSVLTQSRHPNFLFLLKSSGLLELCGGSQFGEREGSSIFIPPT